MAEVLPLRGRRRSGLGDWLAVRPRQERDHRAVAILLVFWTEFDIRFQPGTAFGVPLLGFVDVFRIPSLGVGGRRVRCNHGSNCKTQSDDEVLRFHCVDTLASGLRSGRCSRLVIFKVEQF